MKDLHVIVNDEIATYQKRDGDIVCGNKHNEEEKSGYQIKFTFDTAWDAHDKKIARFIWGGHFQDVEFTGDTCPVPVISGATLCEVGVYAGDLHTTTSAFIGCKPSILCHEASPSVENDGYYANEARKYAEEAKEAAAAATESGATFTPSVAADGTLSWTNNKGLENPAPVNIKGEKGDQGDKGDTYTLTEADKTEIAEKAVGIPEYVKTEAEEVINKVIAAQGSRTFTFAAITDMHFGSWGYYEGITDYPDGIKHACQALKYIDERIKLDAVAVLGDYTDGMAYDQYDTAVYDFKGVNAVLDKLRFSPNLRLVGNHDFHIKHSPLTYRYVTAYSDDVEWGSCLGGYFYKDFSAQKIRVICLNTSERNHTSVSPTTEQYRWFINSLNLSAKEDASDWQILILSHIPLDFWADNGAYNFAYILKAYLNGDAWSDGADISCNFANKNVAKIVGNIHGHTHNFTVDKLYLGNIEDSTEQINIWRMATPNSCFGAENKNYAGYKQETAYPKTANSATDTAFCIYCIDLDTCTIKAITYGAGYDRELTYHTEPAFINLLPLSTGADDSVYNGVGWKANTRWSGSSQIEKSYEGLYLSGYISIEDLTTNGTCYMKDVNFITGGAGTNEIIYFTEKGLREYSEDYGNIEGGVYDENGVLTQFTVQGGYFKYFRIASCGFSEASVVTINQPIE